MHQFKSWPVDSFMYKPLNASILGTEPQWGFVLVLTCGLSRPFPENIGRLMCGMVNLHYKMNTILSHCVLFRDLDQFLLVFFFTSLLSKIKKWKLIHFMYCISMQITESTKHTIHLHAHIVLAIIKVCFCLADRRHHLLHNIEYKNSTRNIQNVRAVS